jgi:hypothetical protein
MNAKQANKIPITSYLEAKGIMPIKRKVHYSMYRAPYRNDHQASLKVSHRENLWIDYGEGIGGTLVDLVLKINSHQNVSEAIRDISETINTYFSFHQQKTLDRKNCNGEESRFGSWNNPDSKHDSMGQRLQAENQLAVREKIISNTCTDNIYHLPSNTGAISIQYLKDNMATPDICGDGTEYISDKAATHNMGTSKMQNPIYNSGAINVDKLIQLGNNPIIISYMNQRGIQVVTAKPYCKEIYYQVNRKRYFGIAHRNNKGWSIRNKYWKGCTAQGYSYYNNQQNSLLIFEGIFDFLSYLELKPKSKMSNDIMILNSLVNLKSAQPILGQYQNIKLYLDHDAAGRRATQYIQQQFPIAVDQSSFYSHCKDLNEYHFKKVKGELVKEEGNLKKEN